MYEALVFLSAAFMMVGAIWYSFKVWTNKIDPPPAGWIILTVGISLSWVMYVEDPDWSYTGNIGLTSAVVNIWLITLNLLSKLAWEKRLRVSFNLFQWWMMATSLVIVAFWAITEDEFVSYILLQVTMLVGYLPIIQRLKTADRNTESFAIWSMVFLASVIALYPALVKDDVFAMIYVGRAVPSTAYIIWLMLKHELGMMPVNQPAA